MLHTIAFLRMTELEPILPQPIRFHLSHRKWDININVRSTDSICDFSWGWFIFSIITFTIFNNINPPPPLLLSEATKLNTLKVATARYSETCTGLLKGDKKYGLYKQVVFLWRFTLAQVSMRNSFQCGTKHKIGLF